MRIVKLGPQKFCVMDNNNVIISADSLENLYKKALDVLLAFSGPAESNSVELTNADTEVAMSLLNNTYKVDNSI